MGTAARRALAALTMITGTLALAQPASAAPPVAVDFTVSETLPLGTPGTLTSSDIPGCPAATVTTFPELATTAGPVSRFVGTKVFDCGGGDTFTLRYDARVIGCAPTDDGRWNLLDGTGAFAGASGRGSLVGTYTLGDGPGDACSNDGIDDRYTGRIQFG